MSFFKKLFSSNDKDSSKTDKKTGTNIKKDLNPEHQQIVELYTQKNPTSFTSKEILEGIAEELGKKPGGVRSILSKAGVYIKQEKLTWQNNKELLFKKIASDRPGWVYSHLADELKNDEEIAFMAVTDSAFQYKELPEKFKFNRDFLMKSIDIVKDQDADYVQHIFYDELLSLFKEDKEVLLKGWNSQNPKSRSFSHFSDILDHDGNALTKDREFMLEAVKEDPLSFLYVSLALRNDSSLLDIVAADNFSDYCDRVHPSLLKETYGNDEDEDYDDDDEDEVIEIP